VGWFALLVFKETSATGADCESAVCACAEDAGTAPAHALTRMASRAMVETSKTFLFFMLVPFLNDLWLQIDVADLAG
jgi:hypothetical protein